MVCHWWRRERSNWEAHLLYEVSSLLLRVHILFNLFRPRYGYIIMKQDWFLMPEEYCTLSQFICAGIDEILCATRVDELMAKHITWLNSLHILLLVQDHFIYIVVSEGNRYSYAETNQRTTSYPNNPHPNSLVKTFDLIRIRVFTKLLNNPFSSFLFCRGKRQRCWCRWRLLHTFFCGRNCRIWRGK